MKISILPAEYGDAISISFYDSAGQNRNILIDGGPRTSYESKNSKKRVAPGALKQVVERIKALGERIDLLVISHVDHDHIGGILNWFSKDVCAAEIIETIWFNSGRIISEYFFKAEKRERLLRFIPSTSRFTSISEGVIFEELITEKDIWFRSVIKAPDKYNVHGATITILSPDDDGLGALEERWDIERHDTMTMGKGNDYAMSVTDHLAQDRFTEDRSVPNRSSIAFLLTQGEINLLFLADAHPGTVCDTLRFLGYSEDNRLQVDLIKLSHHGSRGNTSNEILDLVSSKRFVVSTNGERHGLPHKQCLARVIDKAPGAELYFNYPVLIPKIFSDEDLASYPELVLRSIETLEI